MWSLSAHKISENLSVDLKNLDRLSPAYHGYNYHRAQSHRSVDWGLSV